MKNTIKTVLLGRVKILSIAFYELIEFESTSIVTVEDFVVSALDRSNKRNFPHWGSLVQEE